jgi:cytochrome c oxidase assembly protein subunit 15
MAFSKSYIRLNWLALILIYLVIIAGSVVRTTGSGMGCPDWPKCFGQWVPPTSESQLPENYRDIYGEKRVAKVEKFARFLSAIGMSETAERIQKDPQTYEELPFNAGSTWTEYINRLVGFLAGNAMLLAFLWLLLKYRKDRRLVVMSTAALFLLVLNAWFGSIVVATNLVPWTITLHMFLALALVFLQLMVIRRICPVFQKTLHLPQGIKWLVIVILIITTYQMFLGTQVREFIDELKKQNIGREGWSSHFGWSFFIHRSFSWLVLILIALMTWLNFKTDRLNAIYLAFALLSLELIGGVLLAYADMPGLVQVSHLFFAAVLFGVLSMLFIRMRPMKGISAPNRLRS